MLFTRFVAVVSCTVLTSLGCGLTAAQDFPNKLIRIVTLAAGGGSDIQARIIAEKITGPLGQTVVIDNRATGIIATETALKSPADGHTMLINGNAFWVLPLLQKVPYDPEKDFTPVSMTITEVSAIAVHPSIPARSIKEFVAIAKTKPGQLNYASGSPGGMTNLGMELFKSMTGTDIVKVPYKNTSMRVAGLITGEAQVGIFNGQFLLPYMKLGKVKVLAITSTTPSALLPDVPPVSSFGLTGFEASDKEGVWVPAKTPEAAVRRLNQEIVRALNLPDVKERFLKIGVEVVATSPEAFAATIRSDIVKWGKVIKDAGIKIE